MPSSAWKKDVCRSEEHTSELQSLTNLVCRLLLEKNIKELSKLGLMGTIFPTAYGGAGRGYVEYVTASKDLPRVDGSVGIIVAAHTSLCSNHIVVAGNEGQKRKD